MKRTFIFSAMLILALTMFSGCASRPGAEPEVEVVYRERVVYVEVAPPEPEREIILRPLTPALLERLDTLERLSFNIPRLQFVISGAVTMERGAAYEHPLELSGTRARIRNERLRHIIRLDDSTWGEALGIQHGTDESILAVSFDDDRGLYLNFVNTGDDPEGLFYLSYISPEGFEAAGSGFLMYGSELFSLSYAAAEGTPYLLVVLSEYDEDRLFVRTLPGRTVN